MNRLTIVCVEDEPEVRDALMRDLEPLIPALRVECAEDVADARQVFAECARDGDPIGLVLCDHVLPGENGVEFLVELNRDEETAPIRKVLVTGQAGQDETVKAVNEANLDHYIAKPWLVEDLRQVVREQLTNFALDQLSDLTPYIGVLDGSRLLDAISERGYDR